MRLFDGTHLHPAVHYVATALDHLAECSSVLARWHRQGTETFGLHAISTAWLARRDAEGRQLARRPDLLVDPLKDPLLVYRGVRAASLNVDRHHLYLLLQSRTQQVPTDVSLRNLEAWLFVRSIQLAGARAGQVRQVRNVANMLRHAAYEPLSGPRRLLIESLGSGSPTFKALNESIAGASLPAHGGTSTVAQAHRALVAMGEGRTDYDSAEEATDAPGSHVAWPLPILDRQVSSGGLDRATADEGDLTDLPDCTLALDEPSAAGLDADVVEVDVDEAEPPAAQLAFAQGVQLFQAAGARFLPWEWSRPNPPERDELDRLVRTTLDNAAAPVAERLLVALVTLAIDSAQSLADVLAMPLAEGVSAHPWRLDLQAGCIVRLAPRRAGHWTPSAHLSGVLKPAAPLIAWHVEPQALEVLRLASSKASTGRALVVKQLWDAHSAQTERNAPRASSPRASATPRRPGRQPPPPPPCRVHGRLEQPLLGAEVVVHGHLGHTGVRGDGIHTLQAMLNEVPLRRFQDALYALGIAWPPA